MKLYRNKSGEKMYPVCNWENNQHKLYNAEDRIMISWYEALESGTKEEYEEACRNRERIERAMRAFESHVINGMVYATWADRNLILDYVWAYNARH